ncbi:MAG: HAMP domain-containing histidine kinase [Burkholderiales bacterium]|nr:HAMP domain-containing histidine kinase [Anaerolineae bacterium]
MTIPVMLLLRSIRWRLPLSYAAIALLATLALGLVLMPILRDYYLQREQEAMSHLATAISLGIGQMPVQEDRLAALQTQFNGVSFLTQTRIQILDIDRKVILDTGIPDAHQAVLSYSPDESNPDANTLRLMPSPGAVRDFAAMFYMGRRSDGAEGMTRVIRQTLGDIADDSQTQVYGPVEPPQGRFAFPLPPIPFSAGVYAEGVDGKGSTTLRRSDQYFVGPIVDDSGMIIGYVQVSYGLAYGSAILDRVMQGWLVAGAVAVALAASVGWFISRSMSTPLLALTDVTERMAGGDLSARANTNRQDEIGALARSFNGMAGKVEGTVTTLRRFVGDAAHELHTPLTALNANLELAASEPDDAKRVTFIERAREQLKRLESLTMDLLDLSRFESDRADDKRVATDLVRLAQEASEVYASRAEQRGLVFTLDIPPDGDEVVARVNEGQFRRVVGNLLDNAIKFTPEGTVSIGLTRRENTVELWVKDTGIGIPADDLPLLFSRFHRGRNVSALPGSGLGLAIIKAIVEAHRGDVVVESGAQGTRFAVRIPAVS